jgi:hypothetical protein
MPKTSLITEVRNRLLRAGFSSTYANRAARELHEHCAEIIDEGLRLGLTQAEAEREAFNRLGSSEALADEFIVRLQSSSWLGRYPTIGFAVLALALTVLWWVGVGSAVAQYCGLFSDAPSANGAAPKFDRVEILFDWVRTLSYVAVPWLCCHIASRYFCGWRPSLWACLVLAIHNGAQFFTISGAGDHGNVAIGYTFGTNGPPLLPIIAPLAVFALHRAWSLRDQFQSEDSGPTFC